MRSNKMFRLASVLLVLVILTTCAISGTFAKYTTSVSATDSARVAYWGFNSPSAVTFELFSDNYDNVKSNGEEKVIAPGTEKSATFSFAYTEAKGIKAPEVAYDFKVEASVGGNCTELDSNTNFHWVLDDNTYDKAEDLMAAVKALSGEADGTKTYAAGTIPEAFKDGKTHSIGWVWDFGKGDATQDAADTKLGNANLADIALTITITATQVD